MTALAPHMGDTKFVRWMVKGALLTAAELARRAAKIVLNLI